jgi:PadR family transcriptional regulator, regulatory protein AphA
MKKTRTLRRLMNYQFISNEHATYVECLPDGGTIESEADALDLVAACGEYQCHRLLLHASNLTPDFYNLRSGLAGAVLLKFSNYRVQAAAILTPELAEQGRFGEMVLESNRGSQFRVFYDRASAEEWLARL